MYISPTPNIFLCLYYWQKITDNIKGKVCSLAVCAVAWLVAHVRMLGLDERDKSLQMIRQLGTPLYGDNILQFYNERYVILYC